MGFIISEIASIEAWVASMRNTLDPSNFKFEYLRDWFNNNAHRLRKIEDCELKVPI